MKSMTSYERVMNRLEGKAVDKTPNMNTVMAFAAKQVSATLREFITDYKVLVESELLCADKFGIDKVSVISDPMREAHGFGAKIIFPEDDNPYCKDHLMTDLAQINQLTPVSPLDNERMLDRIKAVELRDISLVMMDLMMAPNKMHELFAIISEQQKIKHCFYSRKIST